MKTIWKMLSEETLEQFADKHNLVLEIVERDPQWCVYPTFQKFYAYFHNVEIKDGCILRDEYGNGQTPEDAVNDYKRIISLKKIVVNAMSDERREIDVPRII